MDRVAQAQVGWLLLCALACALCVWQGARRPLARLPHPFLLAALAAVVARLTPALLPLSPEAFVTIDLRNIHGVAAALNAGRDVYDLKGAYAYLPLQMHAFALADRLADGTGLPFLLLVKAPVIAADATLAALVGWIAVQLGRGERAPALAFIAALNPIGVLVSGYHGQFDAIPLVLLVAAWATLRFHPGRGAVVLAAALFGLAVAEKTWPLLVLPLLMWRVSAGRTGARRLVWAGGFAVLAALPSVLALAWYELLIPGGAQHALQVATGYRGMLGVWGYSFLIMRAAAPDGRAAALELAAALGPFVLVPALALAYWSASRLRSDLDRMALIIVTAYAASAGWGIHWLIWLTPLALLSGRRWAGPYLVAGSAYLTLAYLGFGGVAWGIVWFTHSLRPLAYVPDLWFLLWLAFAGGALITCGRTLGAPAVRLLRTPIPSGTADESVGALAGASVPVSSRS